MEKTCSDLRFFYGSSNPELGKLVAKGICAAEGKLRIKKFANGETYAQFLENIRGKDVFLMQTAVEPINDNLVELLIMIDAAKRASAGRVTVITPNYFYARQDRKADSREPITAKLVADLVTAAGADRVVTMDVHSDQIQGFFNIPFDNLHTSNLFIERAKLLVKGPAVVVAPDAGSAKKATKIALAMGLELAIINKMRAEHNEAKALNIIGADVSNKTCLMFDDLIDTGGSLCSAARILKENGADKIFAFATHGVFSGDALEKIGASKLDKVVVSDSLPLRGAGAKIEILSIADYLASAILCIHNNESVSVLFRENA